MCIRDRNFNACAAVVHIIGVNVHPGSAQNVMVNAGQVATEFNALLPNCDTPRYTEGYEGFFHLTAIAGTAERAELRYILRDHDGKKLEMRREMMEHIAKTLNARYGEGTVSVSFREQYRNMAEKIRPDHIHLVENAVKAAEECGVKPLRQPIRGGTDVYKRQALEHAVREALAELGMAAEIDHVTDFAQIAAYGVMTTPALVVDGRVVSYGKVLKKDEAKALIQKIRG